MPLLAAGFLLGAALAAAPDARFGTWESPVLQEGVSAQDPPPHARAEVLESLRQGAAAARHPSDGGGEAWLVEDESERDAVAGQPGEWTIVYQAGERGVAEDGAVYLQVSPFWGWSTPQTESERLAGYTRVTTEVDGLELEPVTIDQQLLAVHLRGRGLEPGEQLRIVYRGTADRFAEQDSRFWIAVDGDGDGVREVLADSPGVAVRAGPTARLHLVLPTTAEPGEVVRLSIAMMDARCNVGGARELGEVFFDLPEGLKLRGGVGIHDGTGGVDVEVEKPGLYRIKASFAMVDGESNPMLVREGAPTILWGDLQIHTGLSDGTGILEEVWRYARNAAALDFACITDHDRWGLLFLDEHPEMWQEMKQAANERNEPGRFTTFLGFEWTNWIYGHRHVVYGGDDGALYSSFDERYDHPEELWKALEGQDAITIAHHSAGGPVPIDWRVAPDPVLEPVTEIVSVHGSSEAPDSPGGIYRPVAGNFVRDALDRGYRLGFLGSTDGHDGHPGLSHLAGANGGLVAVFAEQNTRAAIFEALRARRVYATNGERILLRFSLGEAVMGGVVQAADGPQTLRCRVVGTEPIERIDLIYGVRFEDPETGESRLVGALADSVPAEGRSVFYFEGELPALKAGEYVYARVVQQGRGVAWSSPIWVE